MSTTTVSPVATATETIDELDNDLRGLAGDDAFDDVDPEQDDEETAIAMPSSSDPAKLTKSEKKAAAAEEAKLKLEREAKEEQQRVQALVPWKVLVLQEPRQGFGNDWSFHEQASEITRWADEKGAYPKVYRSYARDEWAQAIDALASAVTGLAETDPEYQREMGLYVEEHTSELLLIRAKKWQLLIHAPSKATASSKKFLLSAQPGGDDYRDREERPNWLADLLANHVPVETRDTLLNIACQYMRDIRIRVNKTTWAQANPELARYMLPPSKR